MASPYPVRAVQRNLHHQLLRSGVLITGSANVEQIVTAVDGPTLTLKYKDGEKKIFVPANTPIVV
jgi:hypothetical protein